MKSILNVLMLTLFISQTVHAAAQSSEELLCMKALKFQMVETLGRHSQPSWEGKWGNCTVDFHDGRDARRHLETVIASGINDTFLVIVDKNFNYDLIPVKNSRLVHREIPGPVEVYCESDGSLVAGSPGKFMYRIAVKDAVLKISYFTQNTDAQFKHVTAVCSGEQKIRAEGAAESPGDVSAE